MKKKKGVQEDSKREKVLDPFSQLYQIPDHLQVCPPQHCFMLSSLKLGSFWELILIPCVFLLFLQAPEKKFEESNVTLSSGMLTAIPEVDLGIE